jgi:A/G-specific adenine glycosylase
MLQQTRVSVVIDYFHRFVGRFPTVHDLAAAPEQEVMALWSGLGYYRRARMLHAGAKQVVCDLNGVIPESAAELQELPGIGRYTASAIASICHNEITAVVDGNVERVLDRLHGKSLPRDEHWKLSNTFISPRRPGDFNQAMMELGATVCTPQNPLCGECPLRKLCRNSVSPLKPTVQAPRIKKDIFVTVDSHRGRIRLIQRSASERLMPLMWELPPASVSSASDFTVKHAITKTDYTVKVVAAKSRAGKYVAHADLARLPLTGLTRKVLRKSGILI